MLTKLAFRNFKDKFKDYLVLFSGLLISSAIFYMFMDLATNKKFIKSNSPVSVTPIIFGFGIVLLAIITLLYISYSNGFLLSMKKKQYGLFMMLGARKKKIVWLMFLETILIGFVATVVGIFLGVIFAKGLGNFLVQKLDLSVHGFSSFYAPAAMYTFIFFMILFILAGLKNGFTLQRSEVLTLMKGDDKPANIKKVTWKTHIKGILGIVFLGIGYWSMKTMASMPRNYLALMWIALITIILGTFLLIGSFIPVVINGLKKNHRYSMKKLNNFTLSQLGFRIPDYTKLLTLVTLLFSLALGAITVGSEFKDTGLQNAEGLYYYDVVIHNTEKQNKKNISKLDKTGSFSYHYKVSGNTTYYNLDEFKNKTYKYPTYDQGKQRRKKLNKTTFTAKDSTNGTKESTKIYNLNSNLWMGDIRRKTKFVSATEFNSLKYQSKKNILIKTTGVDKNGKPIQRIINKEMKIYSKDKQYGNGNYLYGNSKYGSYKLMSDMQSGLSFMGLFLGIAFLAMMASCLMFKVLSGASRDSRRYQMLFKMGTRNSWLRGSIFKEIGILFLIPAVLGVINVLFGLRMFKSMLPNAYDNLAQPFTIFFVLYLVYYLITVALYQGIVLKNNK